jgi:hypothetical protein
METITNYLVTQVQSHANVPISAEVLEAVLESAEEAVKLREASGKPLPLEFALADAARALWATAHQGNRQGVDWPAYVRSRIAKKDTLFSRLFKRKSEVQQSIDDLKQFESDVIQARAGLKTSEVTVSELTNSIAATEQELYSHSSDAVEASIQEAAQIWNIRDRSPHNGSIVDASVEHAVRADVVNRILNARLILLKDKLSAEQAKVVEFSKRMKSLEKQG